MKTIKLSKSVMDSDREIFDRHVAACQKHQQTGRDEDLAEVYRTAEAVNASHELLGELAEANSSRGAVIAWVTLFLLVGLAVSALIWGLIQ